MKKEKILNSPSKTTFKYFWKHVRNYKFSVFFLLFSAGTTVILQDIIVPVYIKILIDLMSEYLWNDKQSIFSILFTTILLISAFHLLWSMILSRIRDFYADYFASWIMKDIENDCFKILQSHSFWFFADNFIWSLVSKISRLIHSFDKIFLIFIWDFYPWIIRFIFSVWVLFYFAPIIAWILIWWVVVYLFILYRYSNWKMKYDTVNAQKDSNVTWVLADSLTNTSLTKLFNKVNFEINRFFNVTKDRMLSRRLCWNLNTISNLIQSVLMLVIEFIIMYVLIKSWVADEVTIWTIVLVQAFLNKIFENLWSFWKVIREYFESIANAQEMIEILNTKPEVNNVKNPEKCKISRWEIEFKNVNFHYEKWNAVFNKFNLKIKAWEKIWLIWESWAWKTTITKMLLRFSDIESGQILIDKQDISRITQEDLRDHISFVPQEPILFHRALKENIRYWDLNASDEQVVEIAKQAYANEFINNTPKWYDTLVWERWIKLSGWERQRISIARAMLKNSPILILDEATSSLDSKSEKYIQQALEKLMKNRTAIVIAHRLSTIQKMDRILVVDWWDVIEEWSHNELLEINWKYAELWKHQAWGFI